MAQSKNSHQNIRRIYRTLKPSIAKRIGKMVLEQAIIDLMRQGNPIDLRNKHYKDAKEFFDNQDYDFYCECAEIDVGAMDRWYEGLDLEANRQSL